MTITACPRCRRLVVPDKYGRCPLCDLPQAGTYPPKPTPPPLREVREGGETGWPDRIVWVAIVGLMAVLVFAAVYLALSL